MNENISHTAVFWCAKLQTFERSAWHSDSCCCCCSCCHFKCPAHLHFIGACPAMAANGLGLWGAAFLADACSHHPTPVQRMAISVPGKQCKAITNRLVSTREPAVLGPRDKPSSKCERSFLIFFIEKRRKKPQSSHAFFFLAHILIW